MIATDTLDADPAPTLDGARFFRATASRFDRPEDRAVIDALGAWIADHFRKDLQSRPSRHVYISTLPAPVIAQIDDLRGAAVVEQAIRRQFRDDVVITPMHPTDELYISHYNLDRGGDQGLFDKHYDGNLRFLPIGAVVRALIYVRSSGHYKVVFADSKLTKGFETYDLGLLDFHRELHWVEGSYEEDGADRIVLKCNYMVVPARQKLLGDAVMALNLFQFFVVKAAMEASKSPQTLWQHALGRLCNVVRELNNIHPLLPHVLFSTMALAVAVVVAGLITIVVRA